MKTTPFLSIKTEGGLLPPDILERIARADKELGGLEPAHYHLPAREKLNEAVSRSWNRVRIFWEKFQKARQNLSENQTGTSITRELWLLPLFQELGYGRLLPCKAQEIDGKTYPISHFWHKSPFHFIGCNIPLDKRTRGVKGAASASPHSMVQEFLNRSEPHLWGFLSNGLKLRILRDNLRLTRQAYVEFDLEAMLEEELFSDFALFWLICHESRVEAENIHECWLEKWARAATRQGIRILDRLRNGVEQAITFLGQGFLAHPENKELKQNLRTGRLNKQDYFRQLLRLVYRLLFLFAAEDRNILFPEDVSQHAKDIYYRYYSTTRLRKLAAKFQGNKYEDLYIGLKLVMGKLGQDGCPHLGLPALGSFLWSEQAIPDLQNAHLSNEYLLPAIRSLAFTLDEDVLRPVDFKNIGAQELGSVYESLLELHPELNLETATFELQTVSGHERKTTGSYYTPSELINELLDSALEPVINEAIKKSDNPEKAILNLKICDPACGSGHFLIAAAHRIAKKLAYIRTGEQEPGPENMQNALRDVIGHCIYGVDINPMAVELCKVSLWLESMMPGKPLSFLDHHIQCGNSLLGATPALLRQGIPEKAFTPITGDDREVCNRAKKDNRKEHKGIKAKGLLERMQEPWHRLGDLATSIIQLDVIDDSTIEGVKRKQKLWEELVRSSGYNYGRLWADAWVAAFVWKKTRKFPYPITEEVFRRIEKNPFAIPGWMKGEIENLSREYQFFHWHLAFPDVFRVPERGKKAENEHTGWDGGFDVVLGNPPWEHTELKEKEWFSSKIPEIAKAPGAKRKKLIAELKDKEPEIYAAFIKDKRKADGISHIIRNSNKFPFCGRGRINTYAIFAEHMRHIINPRGRIGCIVPSGIASDDTTKFYFQDIMENHSLVSLYDFENRNAIFPGVHRSYKFCLLTLTGQGRPASKGAKFAFFLQDTQELKRDDKIFSLTATDPKSINPNTRTCPIFRTRYDAELTKKIYRRVPVLINENTGENPWEVRFATMFHMANDSHLFRTRKELEAEGYELKGNIFVRASNDVYLPLYEAKMIWQFDHRFGSYEGSSKRPQNAPLSHPTSELYAKTDLVIQSWYWVPAKEVLKRLDDIKHLCWLTGFRDVARSTDERTAIFSLLPEVGTNHKLPLIFGNQSPRKLTCLFANINCLTFDYVVRQKMGGTSLGFFILKQLPIFSPKTYTTPHLLFIIPRVLELTYTAWDMKPFADDIWAEADETLRSAISKQWEENANLTANNKNASQPDWLEILYSLNPDNPNKDACPLPPFIWHEDRRAKLKAELDAFYARLYGLTEEELRYILDPQDVFGKDFPGETFRVLKEKEIKQFGEYRTKRLVLEAWKGLISDA